MKVAEDFYESVYGNGAALFQWKTKSHFVALFYNGIAFSLWSWGVGQRFSCLTLSPEQAEVVLDTVHRALGRTA